MMMLEAGHPENPGEVNYCTLRGAPRALHLLFAIFLVVHTASSSSSEVMIDRGPHG